MRYGKTPVMVEVLWHTRDWSKMLRGPLGSFTTMKSGSCQMILAVKCDVKIQISEVLWNNTWIINVLCFIIMSS